MHTRLRRGSARAVLALATTAASLAIVATGFNAAVGATSHPRVAASSTSTVWLCRPGLANDPCAETLDTTVVPATGARTHEDPSDATNSKFACFYVYPTVSTQTTDNANLEIQSAETDVAIAQAAPFSQVCQVWAPMYKQRTIADLFRNDGSDPAGDLVAYNSLLSGWKEFLAKDDDGRPIILIGHSQGSAILIRLLESQFDSSKSMRARLVVAIIPGGNLDVPPNKSVGATLKHVSLCTSSTSIGCVIAYSTFGAEPPADAVVGRPGQGVSRQSDQLATKGVQVACVNPAALSGGTADLNPLFITTTEPPPAPVISTLWVTYPKLYSATCMQKDGASWLQVTDLKPTGRPVVTDSLGPAWGFHKMDLNLALGSLITDVKGEEAAYAKVHPLH
jgi:hypothetical protein